MNDYRNSSSRESSPHRRSINFSIATRERDDDLDLFDFMRNREELLRISDELGRNKIGSLPICKIPTSKPMQKGGYDDFLRADDEKNDYNWLLTPPGTPRFSYLDMEAKAGGFPEGEKPVVLSLSPLRTSRLPNLRIEPSLKTVRGVSNSRRITPSSGIKSLTNRTTEKPSVASPKSVASSRSSIPSSRSRIYAPKPSYGNDGLRNTATRKPSVRTAKSKASSISSTPSSRSIVSGSKPTTWKLSVTTPNSAASSRSCSPSSKSILSASKPSPRSSMQSSKPLCQSSIPKLSQKNSVPPPQLSSVSKASIMPSRNSAMPQGTSLRVKTKPLQPSLIPDFSGETPPNLRTTMPEKTALANRSRPGAPSSARCTTEAPTASRPRRQSWSPSRARERVWYDSLTGDRSSLQTTKLHGNDIDSVTMPIAFDSKMVEKGIDERRSLSQSIVKKATKSVNATLRPKETVKSMSSQEGTGFGRTLSKPALDMALKHMDLRKLTPSSFRPHMNIMSNSSRDIVRAGATKSKQSNIHDSPIATSSNDSSEYGASIAPDPQWGMFDGNDLGSERDHQYNRIKFQGDGRSTNWLNSPEYGENKYGQTLFSDQGVEILSDPMYNATKAYTGSEYYKNKI